MVDWLESMVQKKAGPNLGSAVDDWKTVNSTGIFFKLGKDKAEKEDGWTVPFICCAQDTVKE